MHNKNLASIIIPTFNRLSYLPEAVESAISQTYPRIEIIIVDDGSEGRGSATRRVLKSYLPYVTYVYQEHGGIGAAVNRGLSLAKGDYIQRLDDDDKLEKEKIEKSVQVFEENTDVGLVATGYYIIDDAGDRLRSQMSRRYPGNAQFLFMLMACISAQVAVMVRRWCHDAVGLYRTDTLAEDYEMWLRIARKYRIANIDEPLASYRRHKDNITRLRNLARLEEDTLQFVRSYMEETSLGELIPGIISEPYGYALRAGVYLLKDGMYVRTASLAQVEIRKALALAPDDPLLYLWEMVLAIHSGVQYRRMETSSYPGEYEQMAKALGELSAELQMLKASSPEPSSPEMTSFRGRFGRLRGRLIRETYRKAVAQWRG